MLKFWIAAGACRTACIACDCGAGRRRPRLRRQATPQLVSLFADWRAFNHPRSSAASPIIPPRRWPPRRAPCRSSSAASPRSTRPAGARRERGDYRLVEAEMNGLDFFLRVLKPWARDPGFYQTDLRRDERRAGARGTVGRAQYRPSQFRLSAVGGRRRAADRDARRRPGDARRREGQSRGQPGARSVGLWRPRLQRAGRGAGQARGGHAGAQRPWRQAARVAAGRIAAASRRGRAMRAPRPSNSPQWIRGRGAAPHGPVGRRQGQLQLVSQARPAEPVRLRPAAGPAPARARPSLASLRLEEVRNRALPPIAEISDPAAYRRMAEQRTDKLYRLLVDAGFITDQPYYRAALAGQTGDYTPPAERNFFTHVTALDPLAAARATSSTGSSLRAFATSRTRARSATRRRCSTSTPTGPKASRRRWRKW